MLLLEVSQFLYPKKCWNFAKKMCSCKNKCANIARKNVWKNCPNCKERKIGIKYTLEIKTQLEWLKNFFCFQLLGLKLLITFVLFSIFLTSLWTPLLRSRYWTTFFFQPLANSLLYKTVILTAGFRILNDFSFQLSEELEKLFIKNVSLSTAEL